MSTPRFRRNYADDPTLCDRVFELLETWFTGLEQQRQRAAQLGSRWDDCSTPFVCEEKGKIVSHVGLLNMSYVIQGERRQLGGVHGVCTLESERRQGHFRRLMEELLEFCQGRFETLELTTENPEIYEPFGFRVIPEHRFIASVRSSGGERGFRPVDGTRRSDLDLLNRLLRTRTPVSNRVAVVGELPSLEELLSQLAKPVEEVEFRFSPDRFAVAARAEPYCFDGDYYMVRGPFAAESESFMLPPPARH